MLLLCSGCNPAFANQCTIPTIYATNGQVTSVNLNQNFAACQGTVNGNLDNTNANTASGYRFYQTVSSLPSAGNQGATYFLTSDNSLNLDNGSSFNKLISPSGSPSQGEVLFYGSSGIKYTAVGTSGQPLISQGAGADAIFGNISAAGSVSGAALTSLASTNPGAGILPGANIGGLFGAWTSKNTNTVFQAATDGIAIQYGDAGAGGSVFEAITDSSSTPSTIRARSDDVNQYTFVITPVKKNDYYEMTTSGSAVSGGFMYFISIGS